MGSLFDDAYFGDIDDLFMTDEDRWDQAHDMVPLFMPRPPRRKSAPPPARADEFDIVDDFSDLA